MLAELVLDRAYLWNLKRISKLRLRCIEGQLRGIGVRWNVVVTKLWNVVLRLTKRCN